MQLDNRQFLFIPNDLFWAKNHMRMVVKPSF